MHDRTFVAIPRELDAAPKFLIWDFDSVALFFALFAVGVMAGSLWLGAALGVVGVHGWGKLKNGRHKGFSLHLLYWHLPGKPFKSLPESHRRDFVG